LTFELTNGIGADVTLDAAGFGPTCEAAVWCVRRGGRVVQAGLPIGDKPPIVPMARVANREIEILGSHGLDAADMPAVLQLVAEGKLRVRDLIEREVTLEEGCHSLACMRSVRRSLLLLFTGDARGGLPCHRGDGAHLAARHHRRHPKPLRSL
jgi:alcohol dehydrogenase